MAENNLYFNFLLHDISVAVVGFRSCKLVAFGSDGANNMVDLRLVCQYDSTKW